MVFLVNFEVFFLFYVFSCYLNGLVWVEYFVEGLGLSVMFVLVGGSNYVFGGV